MARKPVLIFDFDGTLAPISKKPEATTISKRTRKELYKISQSAEVIILTGRPSSFVRRQIRSRRIKIIGLHGNEKGRVDRELLELRKRARILGDIPGLRIEDKPLGFAIHYRKVPTDIQGKARKRVLNFSKGTKARVLEGRKAFEFLPTNSKTKADSLVTIIAKNMNRKVLFVGDDRSDLEAIIRARTYKNFKGAIVESSELKTTGV
ncbi:MAG: trehalose-phosphatase, partial [Candidatus Micrarchaeota archaeon]